MQNKSAYKPLSITENKKQDSTREIQSKSVRNNQASANYFTLIEQLKIENDKLKQMVAISSNIQINPIEPVEVDQDKDIGIMVKSIEGKIDYHFQIEKELIQKAFQYRQESDKISLRQEQYQENQQNVFKVSSLQTDDKDENLRMKKQNDTDQKQQKEYQSKIDDVNKEYKQQFDKRNLIYTDISNSLINSINQNYLVSLVKQGVLNVENIEIKQSQQRNAQIKDQQEKQLNILRSQLQLRDNIIEDQQKHLLTQPKVSAQTLTQIKSTQEIIRDAKLNYQTQLQAQPEYHNYSSKQGYASQQKQVDEYNPVAVKSPNKTIKQTANDIKYQQYEYQKSPNEKRKRNLTNNLSLPTIINKSQIQLETRQTRENFLPPIKNNRGRNLTKLEYDWTSGGYNLKVNTNESPKPRKLYQHVDKLSDDNVHSQRYNNISNINILNISRNQSPSQNYNPGNTMHKSFYKYQLQNNNHTFQPQRPQSGMSQRSEKPQGHDILMNDHRILLPGQVQASPYVKSFLKEQEMSKKTRLLKLNQNLKIQQDKEDKIRLSLYQKSLIAKK